MAFDFVSERLAIIINLIERGVQMKPSSIAVVGAVFFSSAHAAELHVYNWSDYIAEDTIEKFEAATGIKTTYDVYDSNELLEAKMLAGNSGYDLVVPTSDFLQRQAEAGVYQALDKSKLPNLKNMDADLMKAAAAYDPDNKHSVIYMWGTTGIGYNVDMVKERLGGKVPGSWDIIFDKDIAARLADCGIAFLDSPTEMIPAMLNYLGYSPGSMDKGELEEAKNALMAVRESVRYFDNSKYIDDLANGEICVAVGWSGDVFQARDRADEAGNGITVGYIIPNEGALQWFDMMAIPADAKNVDEAHQFINFIMDAQITADITNYVWYSNANTASLPMVEAEILSDPGIFPSSEVRKRLWSATVYTPKFDRLVTRAWTEIKTGQ